MKNQLNALLLTAALTGLVGGTSVAAQAANHGTVKVTCGQSRPEVHGPGHYQTLL